MVARAACASTARGVVLHDYFAHRDGGGKLAMMLAEELGWPVVTGSLSPAAGVSEDWPEVKVSARGASISWSLPRIAQQSRLWSRYRGRHEKVVFSGYYTPLASPNLAGARRIYYCNTPPRFLYDQKQFWMGTLPAWARPMARAFLRWYRPRYEAAVAGMETLVVNSENVRRRVAAHLGREGIVVYPPCDTSSFRWRQSEGYYLSTARLDPIKRVDRIIDAFLRMPDKRLIVTSDGPMKESLQRSARSAPNIEFTGAVDAARLGDLLSRCIATIYVPVDEDFGLSPVESLASGKPVIGVDEGGVAETVQHGTTGHLVPPEADAVDIETAVREITPERAETMKLQCQRRASCFDLSVFSRRMRTILEEDNPPANVRN